MKRALPLVLWLAATPAAALEPIDDFVKGWFNVSSNTTHQVHVIPIEEYWAHAIWNERQIVLSPNGGWVLAKTEDVGFYGERALIRVEGNGTCQIIYEFASEKDLTLFGVHDRIELFLVASSAGAQIMAGITDAGGGEGILRATSGTDELLTWDLDEWNTVDVTRAKTLSFRFYASPSAYEVEDIRFRHTGAGPVDVIEWIAATAWPPLPSPPLRSQVWDLVGQPLYETDLVILNVDAGFTPQMNALWKEVPALGGDHQFVEFSWNDPSPYVNSTFEMQFSVESLGGNVPELLPPVVTLEEEQRGFLLTFPIQLNDGGGGVYGTSETYLYVEPVEGQDFTFENVVVTPTNATVGGGWSALWISFDLAVSGNVDDAFPLIRTLWMTDWILQIAPVGVPEIGPAAAKSLQLVARPSVTRAGTEIHASRALTGDASLAVHDVTGRTLRRLAARRGDSVFRWDGRDASGRLTPAGVYFLQLTEGSAEAVRVVRIR